MKSHSARSVILLLFLCKQRFELKRVKFRRDGPSLEVGVLSVPRARYAASLSLFRVETSADFDAAVFSSFPIYVVVQLNR